ncbi:MAG: hypothetical protein ACKVOU_08630 [Cytophagales bacterium]
MNPKLGDAYVINVNIFIILALLFAGILGLVIQAAINRIKLKYYQKLLICLCFIPISVVAGSFIAV